MSNITITHGTATIIIEGTTIEIGSFEETKTEVGYKLSDLDAAYAQVKAAIDATH